MTDDIELAACLEELVLQFWQLKLLGPDAALEDWVEFHERKAVLLARVADDPPCDIPAQEAVWSASLARTQLQEIRAVAQDPGGAA